MCIYVSKYTVYVSKLFSYIVCDPLAYLADQISFDLSAYLRKFSQTNRKLKFEKNYRNR